MSYSHIVTVSFKHQYFKEGIFKSLNTSFAEYTPKIMRDLGLIIKPFPGGFYLLAAHPESLNTNENSLQPIRLYFNSNDPDYINYTVLSGYNPSDTVLYFNNLIDSTLLHESEYVAIDEVIPLSSEKITIAEFEDSNNYIFMDSTGQEIPKDHFQQSTEKSNEFIVTNQPEGLIRIFENGSEITSVFFVPKGIWKKPLGILDIYPGKLYQDYKKSGKQDYVVQFSNRYTIWKYFLVSPEYQKFKNLSIVNSNNEPIFYPPKAQEIANSMSWVFESINELPLLDYSEKPLKLVNEETTDVLKSLPRPSPVQLYRDDKNSTEPMYSHIYI